MENQNTKTYFSSKPIYGIAFHPDQNATPYQNSINIAISSMETSQSNLIEIISITNPDTTSEETHFSLLCDQQVKYPITKLEWSLSHPSILAASSDILRLYSFANGNQLNELVALEHTAPLTSLNWNPVNPSLIAVSSNDTTASVYDINLSKEIINIKGNNKECYDIAYSADGDSFFTCGGDGAIRMFDMRTNSKSTLIYESKNKECIMKLSVNQINDNFLSFTSLDSSEVNIIDRRNPNMIYKKMSYHKDNVNNCIWGPNTNCFVLSVGDDHCATLWDVQSEALLSFTADFEVENCAWGYVYDNWVGIAGEKCFMMLKVE